MEKLKVIGLTIILLSLSVLGGCSAKVTAQPTQSVTATSTDTSPTPTPTLTPTSTPKIPVSTTKPNSARDLAWEEANQEHPWINPGSIDIGNFRAGGRVEYPVYYHNGDNVVQQQTQVTTGTNDPTVSITLKYKLFENDSKYITYVSDLPEDKLGLSGYESSTNTVTLEGLIDNSQRIINLTYLSSESKTYQIYYRVPDKAPDGGYSLPDAQVKDWVTLSESILEMQPRETREIIVTLEMPEGATTSTKKWAYLIGVSGTGFISTENPSLCRVTMR